MSRFFDEEIEFDDDNGYDVFLDFSGSQAQSTGEGNKSVWEAVEADENKDWHDKEAEEELSI